MFAGRGEQAKVANWRPLLELHRRSCREWGAAAGVRAAGVAGVVAITCTCSWDRRINFLLQPLVRGAGPAPPDATTVGARSLVRRRRTLLQSVCGAGTDAAECYNRQPRMLQPATGAAKAGDP